MLPINSLIRNAFKRLHYPIDVIAQCVRCYQAYALSLRNLEEMMAERGIAVDHSTLHRWVIRLVPMLDKAFRRHKRSVGRRWRMDQTYIKIKGQWKYLYRAVDTAGHTIDFLLTAKRDAAAALRFFRKAIRDHGEPEVVTIDKSGANAAALTKLNADKPDEEAISVRQSKYLNNLIEQDHRNIKRWSRPMLGCKSFRRAQTILAGIELIHMIRKGQYQHQQSEGLSPAEQFYLLAA
ncbi:IS6 family transposase [Serratia fonticola]